MSQYAAFITTQHLKDNSPVISYVEDMELRNFIKIAQETSIQKVLGTNLFTDIKNKVILNTLNSDETNLMINFIQMATIWATIYEYALYSSYKFTNKGITKQNSENSTSADMLDIQTIRDDARNKAEYFKDRLSKYLIANSNLFSTYLGGTSDASTIHPTYQNYFFGIYTGKRKGSNCDGCPDNGQNPDNWIDLSGKY